MFFAVKMQTLPRVAAVTSGAHTHRNHTVYNGLLEDTLRCLLQFGQEHGGHLLCGKTPFFLHVSHLQQSNKRISGEFTISNASHHQWNTISRGKRRKLVLKAQIPWKSLYNTHLILGDKDHCANSVVTADKTWNTLPLQKLTDVAHHQPHHPCVRGSGVNLFQHLTYHLFCLLCWLCYHLPR